MNPELFVSLIGISIFVTLIYGLIPFLVLIGTLSVFFASRFFKSGQIEEDNPWQTLATINGLKFKPNSFKQLGPQAWMTGNYRNHRLKLEVITAVNWGMYSLGQTYPVTRLTLFTNRHHQATHWNTHNTHNKPDTPDELIGLLAPDELFNRYEWKGHIKVRRFGQEICYEYKGIERDIEYLQALFDLLSHIADIYPKIVAFGSEMVPLLGAIAVDIEQLESIAVHLIIGIQQETTQRLSQQASSLVCPHCFVHCAAHQVKVGWRQTYKYYGCRRCGQSIQFIQVKRQIVAILDTANSTQSFEEDDNLYVNWFIQNHLFDFDEVEIIQATNQAVERFAIKVGNDTDSIRQESYKQMNCMVWLTCGLSENTLRILQKVFGVIEIKDKNENK